jgi:hypothetical protein
MGLVGAPLVGALGVGTHEGCPYETCELFAKWNSGDREFKVLSSVAMQRQRVEATKHL